MAIDLKQFVLDPTKSIGAVIREINKSSNGQLEISDATNGFMDLLEASAALTSAAINENSINTRAIFPVLGVTDDDLYKHISDEDIIGITSIPSTANITFALKKVDLEFYGIQHDGYKKCSIPLNTTILINNIYFTLLNKIDIMLYDSGEISIEQNTSPNGLGIDYIYILDNYIQSDTNNIDWVYLQTIAKQVKREVITESVISAQKFMYEAAINEKFFFTEVYAINKDNSRIKLEVVYNDTIFDLNAPSIYVKFLEDKVVYELPMIYQLEGKIDGKLEIILYTTKGVLNIPTEVLTPDNISIILGDSLDVESSIMKQINKYALSRGMLSYGTNGKTIEEVKKSVIFNTVGKIDLPVTLMEKEEEANREGFNLYLQRDTVTKRTFVASRELLQPNTANISTKCDFYMDSVSFALDNVEDKNKIVVLNDNIIIKSKNMFKFNNGNFEILSDSEVFSLSTMTKKELVSYLANNKVFYNPFYYVLEKDYNSIKSRVYDLDNPYLSELKISGKNQDIEPKCNIIAYNASITNDGYKLVFQVSGNDNFNNLRPAFIYCQISAKLAESSELIYFTEQMKTDNNGSTLYFEFNLKSDFFISDNGIVINNGVAALSNKVIALEDYMDLALYTLDPMAISTNDSFNYHDKILLDDKTNLSVMTLENFKYKVGQQLKFIWPDVRNFYTNKKFKTYKQDSFAKYSENIYEYNPETQGIIWYVRNPAGVVTGVEYKLLHKKGDVILDDYNQPMYAYRKGDYILDSNGNMILDGTSGIVRAVDLLLVDYKFLVAGNYYPTYVREYTNDLITWLTHNLSLLNKSILEQTEVLFKPTKNLSGVKLVSNDLITSHESLVSPSITLYLRSNIELTSEKVNTYRDTIGNIIHTIFDNGNFSISDIRNNIINTLGNNVLGVKIENITSDNREIISINEDDRNLFTLNKSLHIDSDGNLEMSYDIDLKIERNI